MKNSIYKIFTITSLIHLCDQSLYLQSQVDTISIRNWKEYGINRLSHLSIGRAAFNPHRKHETSSLAFHQDWLLGISLFTYRVISIRQIIQTVITLLWGIIHVREEGCDHWDRVDMKAVGRLRRRGWVLGYDKEWRRTDRQLDLIQ